MSERFGILVLVAALGFAGVVSTISQVWKPSLMIVGVVATLHAIRYCLLEVADRIKRG